MILLASRDICLQASRINTALTLLQSLGSRSDVDHISMLPSSGYPQTPEEMAAYLEAFIKDFEGDYMISTTTQRGIASAREMT